METLIKNRISIKTARSHAGASSSDHVWCVGQIDSQYFSSASHQIYSGEISCMRRCGTLTPATVGANGRLGTRMRGWQGVAAGRLTTRCHIPRRVFLSFDYAAQKSICEWQLAKNDPVPR